MLILTIQKVHRLVIIEVYFKKLIKTNWISIILLFSFYISFVIYNYTIYPDLPFYILINTVVLIVFDADMIYAIRFMRLLKDKVVQWNCQALASFNDHQTETYHKRLFEVYF